MKSEILVIAEAILANTQVLKMLVEKLPAAAQAEVAKAVNPTPVPAPVATVEVAPVQVVTAPVVPTPAPAPIPAAPVVEAAPAPAPVVTATVSPSNAPFNDQKGLVAYVMDSYKTLGPINGAKIQGVLTTIGVSNINDVKPEMYAPLYAGVEALKAGV